MQTLNTTKLFYNKYFYKLEVINHLGVIFREKNLSFARQVLDKLQHQYEHNESLTFGMGLRDRVIKEDTFLQAKNLYKLLSKGDDYMLRVEGPSVCIYTNDKIWIKSLLQSINLESIKSFYEPNINDIDILDKNTIIVDKSNGYEFKVTLGNKKGSPDFANWARANIKLVKVGPTLLEELDNAGYVHNLYFYARDERVLQLCQLMLSNIRRIDKLVVKSDLDK